MATKQESLAYAINLPDQAYIAYLVSTGGLITSDGYVFGAPKSWSVALGVGMFKKGLKADATALPILGDPDDPMQSPSVRGKWFGKTALAELQYPLDKDTFSRKSGGWFGWSWLFGDKTTYVWYGHLEYSPNVTSVPSTVIPQPMPARRWIDGGELGSPGGTTAEGGSSTAINRAARRASRHIQGLGYSFENDTYTRIHVHTEAGATAAKNGWERFYIRAERFPEAPTRIWRVTNANGGPLLTLTATGALVLNDFDGFSTATVIGPVGTLKVHVWYKVDVIYTFGTTPTLRVFLNGAKVIDLTGNPPLVNMASNNNVSQSFLGGGALNGTNVKGIFHIDDWIGADPPLAGYDGGSDAGFIRGSRVAFVGANGFASDHNAAAYPGDWRLARIRPPTAQGVTSSSNFLCTTSGARLSITTDAALEVDAQQNQLGIAAMAVGVYIDKGGAGGDGKVGWKLPGGGDDLVTVVQGFGAYAFSSRMYRPSGNINPVKPLAGLELKYEHGASTDPNKIQTLAAVVEIIGVFGDEDLYPNSALGLPIATPPAGAVTPHIGIHNAPYPHTPWAQQSLPPQSPVVIKTGTYKGNGTALDLKFRSPVHMLWVRSVNGYVIWISSAIASHVRGQQGISSEAIIEVLIDPTFVQGQGVETNMDLPSTPDNLEQALAESNQLAYGFEKNKDDYEPWTHYLEDPDYYWKRMLGWQAGGADIPIAGLYAVPPSPWLSTQQQQTLVRIAGSLVDLNVNLNDYYYVAWCDPGMRFSDAGGLLGGQMAVDVVTPLDNEQFVPEAVLLLSECFVALTTPLMYFKGLGSAATAISQLLGAEIANGLAVSNGTLTYKPGLQNGNAIQLTYLVFRRNDGSGDPGVPKVLWLATYVGDGGAIRTINFAPSGVRPMWAIVVGHNGTTFMRDPYHTGTNSTQLPSSQITTGITAGGIDSITLGSSLNQAGVTYDILVFPGTAAACNNGWGCPGEIVPVDPRGPKEPPWHDPPEPPEPPEGPGGPEPPFIPGPGGAPFGTQCAGASTLLINQALARVGVSKQIGNILTETTMEATVARLVYQDVIDQVLRDFPWPFATHYATLTLVAGPSPVAAPDWVYAYRQPIDCVFERRICHARELGVDPTPPPFQLGAEPDTVTAPVVVAIASNTAGNPCTVVTTAAHQLQTGDPVTIDGTVSGINGMFGVTVVDATTFKIVVTGAVAGTGGTCTGPARVTAVGGPLIYTNEPDAVLEYTCRPGCVARLGDPLFKDALTWRVGAALAAPLSRMADIQVKCLEAYGAALNLAQLVLRPGNPGRPATVAPVVDVSQAAQDANAAVVNRALLRIGAQTITNLRDDQSRGAVAARAIFEEELQSVLRDFAWPFATRYNNALALVAGTPTAWANADWTYSYRLPLDTVMCRRLVSPAGLGRAYDPDPPKFRTGTDDVGPLLYTHLETPVLERTARLEACVLVADSVFRDALAWRLAAVLAPSLAQADPERIEQQGRGPEDAKTPKNNPAGLAQIRQRIALEAWQQYAITLNIARAGAMKEQQQFPNGPARWITAREQSGFRRN